MIRSQISEEALAPEMPGQNLEHCLDPLQTGMKRKM